MSSEEVCFDRDEFGKPDFSAGDFVRKWQASATLELLQDGLRVYMKELKDRLYELINRDYADFVKISSKLAGVDETVEVLALPLRNVRNEVGALHQTVEEMRVDMQEAVTAVNRSRRCSELLQRCIAAVEAASLCQHLLDLNDDDGVGISSKRGLQQPKEAQAMQHAADQRWEHGRGILDDTAALHVVRLKNAAQGAIKEGSGTIAILTSPGTSLKRNTRIRVNRLNYRFMRRSFALERAAHLCKELLESLKLIEAVAQELKAESSRREDKKKKLARIDSTELDADPELGAISLATEVLETMQPLCHTMERECITQASSLFSAAVNPAPITALRPTIVSDKDRNAGVNAVDDVDVADEMLSIGVQSIVRTATLMEKATGLEQLFQRLVMKRAVEELLTPGQLDASGGRGLCKGLPRILRSLYVYVVKAALPVVALSEIACVSEYGGRGRASAATPDLFLQGIVATILTHFLGPLSSIFAPGRANVLQANYRCVHRLLKDLCSATEKLLLLNGNGMESTWPASQTALEFERRILQGETYAALEAKWNLPVYFQLRVSDLTHFLEAHLSISDRRGIQSDIMSSQETPAAPEGESNGAPSVATSSPADPVQKLTATLRELHGNRVPGLTRGTDAENLTLSSPTCRAFCMALLYIWQENVLLSPLVSQALSFTLSVISRFTHWVKKSFDVFKDDGDETALKSPEEAMMLKSDILCVVKWGQDTYVQYATSRAVEMLEEGLGVQSDTAHTREVSSVVSSAILDGLESLSEANAQNLDIVVSAIAKRCSDTLTGVRGISAAYRFTNKPAPTVASAYVANVLRPLAAFERDLGEDSSVASTSRDEKLHSFRSKVTALILDRLESDVKDLLQSVKQMEDALQRRRQPGANKSNKLSDGDKIILQIRLDVESLKESLEGLSLDLSTMPAWKSIQELLSARE